MGVVTKTKFSDFAIHPLIRGDYKFINYKRNIEVNYTNSLKVKNAINSYYKGFAFKSVDFSDNDEIFVIKGDMFENDFSINYVDADFLSDSFFEDKKYKNFIVKKGDVITSLVGSIGKMVIVSEETKSLLNQNNIALRVNTTIYEIKIFAYLLKMKVKELADNVYKNYGYSFLAINDLFDINLPFIKLDKQKEILFEIIEIENEITILKNSKLKPLDIINKVFGEEFGFDWEEFENIRKEKTYYSSLLNYSNNIDCRFGFRFQHKSGKYLMDFLKEKTSKRIKDFIKIPISLGASVSPSQYDEDGDYYYISMATVKKYYFDKNDAQKVSVAYSNENLNKSIEINDIIMTRSGMAIGKFALINEEIDGIYADFTMRIRLENFNPLLAYYYFRSVFFQHLIATHKKGLQNHNIFPSQIQEFPIPDWNEDKQTEIVEKIKSQIDAQNIIDKQIEQKQQQINGIIENAIKTE